MKVRITNENFENVAKGLKNEVKKKIIRLGNRK